VRKTKNFPDKGEPDADLNWARVKFTGVMKDIQNRLFTSRPNQHLANGFADWQEFGFDSLSVERVLWRGETLVLILAGVDAEAARLGLDKYHQKWQASLRKWYECEVDVELLQA
jgi:hypothetical protein